MQFYSAWGDPELMVNKAHELLSEADLVVTYNGDRFDLKALNTEFVLAGMERPAPYASLDLYRSVRRMFELPSYKLAHVASRLDIGDKLEHTGFQLWIDVLNGDPKAQKLMMKYCKQDVLLTYNLHLRLMGWLPASPNANLYVNDTRPLCPYCAQPTLLKRGFRRTQNSVYQRYQCGACGSWSSDTTRQWGVNVRAI